MSERIPALLLLLSSLAAAQDKLSLKALTQKRLDKEIEQALTPFHLNKLRNLPLIRLDLNSSQCAIPLKEIHASGKIDPIASIPGPSKPVDPIAHAAPIQACRN